jgi:hypothetical protein
MVAGLQCVGFPLESSLFLIKIEARQQTRPTSHWHPQVTLRGRAPVAWNDGFSAINDCFSLASYNHWPRWWELNSLSLCPVHLFRFMGKDGRETKQCTLDVLSTHRGHALEVHPKLELLVALVLSKLGTKWKVSMHTVHRKNLNRGSTSFLT